MACPSRFIHEGAFASRMADDLWPVLVGILGSAVLAGITWALAHALRSVHEQRERILRLETQMDKFRELRQLMDRHGIDGLARVLGGGRRAR